MFQVSQFVVVFFKEPTKGGFEVTFQCVAVTTALLLSCWNMLGKLLPNL